MSANSTADNSTYYFDTGLCTFQTCPLSDADIRYVPSLGGNAFYAAIFGALLLIHIFLGIRYRTWGYLAGMIGGLLLEIIGYAGRIQMHINDFAYNPFLMYLITITIAPCFLTASIYLCLSRIIIVYGEHLARFKPKTYVYIFISSDVFSLVLQATGGALSATAHGAGSLQTGIDVMIAGLAFQVVSLAVFAALCADFAWRVRKSGALLDRKHVACTHARLQLFLWTLAIAVLTIFIRSCYRVPELHGGFKGPLASQQVTYMILEGAMIVTACLALTVGHPGLVFGKASWNINRLRGEVAGGRAPVEETGLGANTPEELTHEKPVKSRKFRS